MSTLLPLAIEPIQELFATYEELPFGLELGEFTESAMSQFQCRHRRIEKAFSQSLEEIFRHQMVEDLF